MGIRSYQEEACSLVYTREPHALILEGLACACTLSEHIREQTSTGPAVLSQYETSHLNPPAVFPREFPAFVHSRAALLLLAIAVHTALFE